MKRALLLIAISLALGALLSSCGGSSNNSAPESIVSPPAPIPDPPPDPPPADDDPPPAEDDDDDGDDGTNEDTPPEAENTPPTYAGETVFVVPENALISAEIVFEDMDADVLSYTVEGEDAGFFSIDANTGALTFLFAPDFEAPEDVLGDNVYNITVRADDGTDSATTSLQFYIRNIYQNFALSYGGADYNLTALAASPHEMIIIDLAKDIDGLGNPQSEIIWTADDVVALQGDPDRTVIGYLNLAVINSWRLYWNPDWTMNGVSNSDLEEDAPVWLAEQVPQLEDDVTFGRFIDLEADLTGWTEILEDRIDLMIERGFDGVFFDDVLDYIDRYFDEDEDNNGVTLSATQMRDLVIGLSSYAKSIDPDFQVIVNGAPFIVTNVPVRSDRDELYYAAVDAFLAENYFVPLRDDVGINKAKLEFERRDIVLLALEDALTGQARDDFFAEALEAGFIPYAASERAYLSLDPPNGNSER